MSVKTSSGCVEIPVDLKSDKVVAFGVGGALGFGIVGQTYAVSTSQAYYFEPIPTIIITQFITSQAASPLKRTREAAWLFYLC